MINVSIQAIPNQSLTVQLDNNLYNMSIKAANGVMCIDVLRNNETLLTGERLTAGTPILPYQYLENESGNFLLLTNNDDLPDYTQFGVTQSLVYASNDELVAIRNG